MSPLVSAGTLLIHFVFDVYIIILLLRFILQKLGANWHNPISQFVIQLTEKPLKPIRKIIPGVRGFDIAIIVLALILQLIEVILLWMLQFGPMPHLLGACVVAISGIISDFIYIYIYAIIINAIVSWFPSAQSHPLSQTVYLIVRPILYHIQRIIPLVAGIDVSPVFALLALTIINLLIAQPLLTVGTNIILG
ncbi:MAG TPA: YggT family protein [Coxiellaceae bacterium]|nr:MAG: hypothetical protein A3E81_05195 [Gammaproteobacteria bacterium RIFCSPHIGHO2_12_FULL_36_30]HLB55845.1 YggT family protein [Coxiellaceae bacterium]